MKMMKGNTHMPIQITISGDTAIEALHELRGLSNGLSGAVAPAADTRPVAEEVPAGDERAFPEPKPARKPRAAKAEIAAEPEVAEKPTAPFDDTSASAASNADETKSAQDIPTEASSGSATSASPTDEKPFTLDDARKALGDLLAQPNGKDKAKAVFAEFSATKISDIAEGQIKGFIAAIAKQRGL